MKHGFVSPTWRPHGFTSKKPQAPVRAPITTATKVGPAPQPAVEEQATKPIAPQPASAPPDEEHPRRRKQR